MDRKTRPIPNSKDVPPGFPATALDTLASPWRDLAHLAHAYFVTGQIELAEAVFVQVGQLADPAAPAWAGAFFCALCRGDGRQAATYLELLEATDPAGPLTAHARRLLPGPGP